MILAWKGAVWLLKHTSPKLPKKFSQAIVAIQNAMVCDVGSIRLCWVNTQLSFKKVMVQADKINFP